MMFQTARHFRLLFKIPAISTPAERYFKLKLINLEPLQISLLPPTFFGGGTFSGKTWKQGDKIPVPPNPIMHHANFTVGVENKVAQLKYVRDIVTKSKL
jgi:hypothetical protein